MNNRALQSVPEQKVLLRRTIMGDASSLSSKLAAHSQRLFPPEARKALRRFTSSEAARILGVNDAYLRQLSIDGKGPQPETTTSGKRLYSIQDIHGLRVFLDQGRAAGKYVKGRRLHDHLQVLSIANFKGGSGKTTTSAHLAQYLALHGYRVLAIDLDPQASLSALLGYQPETDVFQNETVYGALRYDSARRPIREVIRKTYFPFLDLIPGNLELTEYEYETPKALMEKVDTSERIFARLALALGEVESDYDVVVVDCPPALGFLTLSAMAASTAFIVTVHPQMLDVMSMLQFLLLLADLVGVVEEAGLNLEYDFMRYVVTRYEPGDGPQNTMVAFMRTLFGERVLNHAVLKSTAISDAGISKQTLYEIEKEKFTRSTYERAMESLESVNGEVEGLIRVAWGRA